MFCGDWMGSLLTVSEAVFRGLGSLRGAPADLPWPHALGDLELGFRGLPFSMALAAVATLGYLVGRWNRAGREATLLESRRELRRARTVARELENTARMIRQGLTKHCASLARLGEQAGQLDGPDQEARCKNLCREAEDLLAPSLRLANQIASVYDEVLQQINHLMTLTDVRTDPLTGIDNRRGLDQALKIQFGMTHRYGTGFAVALFDIDHFRRFNEGRGAIEGDRVLQSLAQCLDEQARETDIVARCAGGAFAVIMPQTALEGACVFGERVRAEAARRLPVSVSGGIAVAQDADDPESLIRRAEDALKAAKSAGRNAIWRHDGHQVEAGAELAAAAG